MKLQSPTGSDIVGTYDSIPGIAKIVNSDIIGDSKIGFNLDYEGETEVLWDEQYTQKAIGQRVFVDTNGDLWLERELELAEET